ncbi:MAG: hypothetical protein ACLSS1_04525, partial [Eubacterium sp.]
MFFEIFSYLRCDFIFDLCFLFCFFTEKTAISFEIKYDEFIKINIKFNMKLDIENPIIRINTAFKG